MNQINEAVIQTRDLTKVYPEVVALDGLTLNVPRNSIFGFLGPNGAGKTTTIKLLLGLIYPTSGSASIFGMDVVEESVEIRTRVGYLPQDPRFYEHMTARETLEFTARFFFQGPDAAIDERVDEMLELVDLTYKADRPVGNFSGGERQRLGIAQAQVNYPDLLILDEPAASLDPLGRRAVLEIMSRLRKYSTIFYSTHILDDVQKVSDMVSIINKGQLVTVGPIETILAGTEGDAYTITFKGAKEPARQRLTAQPWVAGVQPQPLPHPEDGTRWLVSVTDTGAAEGHLLRTLLEDPALVVTDFRRREYELEDIFVELVAGGKDGGQ